MLKLLRVSRYLNACYRVTFSQKDNSWQIEWRETTAEPAPTPLQKTDQRILCGANRNQSYIQDALLGLPENIESES